MSFHVVSRTFDASDRERKYAETTRKYAKARELGRVLGQLDEDVNVAESVVATSGHQSSDGGSAEALKAALKTAIDADQFELAAVLLETLLSLSKPTAVVDDQRLRPDPPPRGGRRAHPSS